MEIGHVVKIDGIDYCISDIKKYGNHQFALTIYGEDENTNVTFFELIDDEDGGTLMREVIDENILKELLELFLYDEEV